MKTVIVALIDGPHETTAFYTKGGLAVTRCINFNDEEVGGAYTVSHIGTGMASGRRFSAPSAVARPRSRYAADSPGSRFASEVIPDGPRGSHRQ